MSKPTKYRLMIRMLSGRDIVQSDPIEIGQVNNLIQRIEAGLRSLDAPQTLPVPNGPHAEHVVIRNISTFYAREQADEDLPPF